MMNDIRSRERPTYPAKFFTSFVEVLRDWPDLHARLEQTIPALGERVSVDVAHRALVFAVEQTRDPDLGLKAARNIKLGAAGGVDYVVSSAPDVRKAVEHAGRYSRLINDVLHVLLVEEGSFATVRLENSVTLPRPASDFEVAGFFRNHVASWFEEQLGEVTVCFEHAAPDDLSEYRATFAPSRLRFSAGFYGFTFDRRLLAMPLRRADPNLQEVLVPYVDESLNRLPAARTVTGDVRSLIQNELPLGGPDAATIASRLGMSLRTLSRRLAGEGTSFRELMDDVRRCQALDHVGNSSLDLSEIAHRLGFSHGAAFHRAFRRWTGQPPLRYRRARGR
jgi:AraC-like DNA-binding protein